MSSEIQPQQGVFAVFRRDGQLFGVPLPAEDLQKTEVVIGGDTLEGPVLDVAKLEPGMVGVISGGVENESQITTMWRELREELEELLQRQGEFDSESFEALIASLILSEPSPFDQYLVIQGIKNGKPYLIPRGPFRLTQFYIDLNAAQFEVLRSILQPLQSIEVKQLRPLAKIFLAQLQLSQSEQA